MSHITNNASGLFFSQSLKVNPVAEFKEVFERADQFANKFAYDAKEQIEFKEYVLNHVADHLEDYQW